MYVVVMVVDRRVMHGAHMSDSCGGVCYGGREG